MSDIDIAVSLLQSEEISIIFIKNKEVLYKSSYHGIRPFVDAINNCGSVLKGSSVADRIIGKASALLCIYTGVIHLYGSIISSDAMIILDHNKIPYKYGKAVQKITNRCGTDLCPFEKVVLGIDDPENAYRVINKIISGSNPINI